MTQPSQDIRWIMEALPYHPLATHSLYEQADTIPNLPAEEALLRHQAFIQLGYISVGGTWCTKEATVQSALSGYEKARFHLNRGALLGPYVIHDGTRVLPNGIMLYQNPAQQ